MSAKGSSHPDGAVSRSGRKPAGPWQDFDEVMERMLDLFGTDRPAGRGHGSETAPEGGRRR
ncbi:hypothetical protein GCM10010302_25800 [Streptomyces polychromogenes]|uniref:Uncharacterized protein n=1 Tax=Streptomyces polychromogenes TaxID=67342 RepID=A0ABN0VC42_9ACTN